MDSIQASVLRSSALLAPGIVVSGSLDIGGDGSPLSFGAVSSRAGGSTASATVSSLFEDELSDWH